MFDPFQSGVTTEQLGDCMREQHRLWFALSKVLIARGICTEDEIVQAIDSVQPELDQVWSAGKEELAKRWREENPEQAKATGIMSQVLGLK